MKVTLTNDEWAMAVQVAMLRQHHSMYRRSKDNLYEKPLMEQFKIHLLGTMGEVAAAKAIGLHWHGGVNDHKVVPDIKPDIEVRHRTKPYYELYVRPDDPKERCYVLTRGGWEDIPEIEVVGWILGGDAVREEWKQSYGGYRDAYFVPDNMLYPLEDLRFAGQRQGG